MRLGLIVVKGEKSCSDWIFFHRRSKRFLLVHFLSFLVPKRKNVMRFWNFLVSVVRPYPDSSLLWRSNDHLVVVISVVDVWCWHCWAGDAVIAEQNAGPGLYSWSRYVTLRSNRSVFSLRIDMTSWNIGTTMQALNEMGRWRYDALK